MPRQLVRSWHRAYWAMRTKSWRKFDVAEGMDRGLDHDPTQPPRTLLGDVAAAGVVRARVFFGSQTGPGAQLVGRRESFDVTDLAQDRRRDDGPDAGYRQHAFDPLILFDRLVDLPLGDHDLE